MVEAFLDFLKRKVLKILQMPDCGRIMKPPPLSGYKPTKGCVRNLSKTIRGTVNCCSCAHKEYCILGAECSNESYKYHFPLYSKVE